MFTKTNKLKIYGFLMYFFGFHDLTHILTKAMKRNALTGDSFDIFTYVFLGLSLLIALAKVWLGRQALCYAKGNGKGTSHILLIRVGIAFGVLALVNDVVELFIGIGAFSEVLSTIVSLIVMYSYYRAAKACL